MLDGWNPHLCKSLRAANSALTGARGGRGFNCWSSLRIVRSLAKQHGVLVLRPDCVAPGLSFPELPDCEALNPEVPVLFVTTCIERPASLVMDYVCRSYSVGSTKRHCKATSLNNTGLMAIITSLKRSTLSAQRKVATISSLFHTVDGFLRGRR